MNRPVVHQAQSQSRLIVTIAGLTAGVFVLDAFFPLGFVIPALYVIPIILTTRADHPMAPFIVAGWATTLTVIGIWTSPIESLQPGLFNRSLVILASWIAATLIWHTMQKHARRELEMLVRARTAALRQSESTLQGFFNATDLMMGVVEVVDGQLVMVITNPAATTNLPFSELGFAPDSPGFWMPYLEAARQSGKTVRVQYQLPSLPNTRLSEGTIASTVSYIGLSEKGNPLYAWIEEDVTERIQIQEKIEAGRRSLELSQAQLRLLTAQLLTAQDDERRRISRELHDEVSQRVINLAFEIDDQLQRMSALPLEVRHLLQMLKNEVAELSDHLRDLSRRLHPSVLEDLGIASALRVCAQEFEQRERVPVRLAVEESGKPLHRMVAECLFRITQEALRNVAKHAEATKVDIILSYEGDRVILRIEDNGRGFVPTERQSTQQGLGLVSMGERVRLVHGTLTVSSDIGRGTHLSISLPLSGISHEQSTHPTR